MGAFLDLLKRKPKALWLDSHDYCAKLLAGDNVPWLNAAEFVAWQRKAQGLLKPDVVSLPLAPVIAAWLDAHPELRETMAAKPRATYPLRILLAGEALRSHLLELVRGLRAALAGSPLALVLPSPRAWLALAYRQAHDSETEIGEDEADSGSIYIADFLRAFGEAGVDALLLEEADDFAPAGAQAFACYQSVLNIAAHYRWDVGFHLNAPCELPADCTFAIAPQPLNGTPTGIALGESFWDETTTPAVAKFHFAKIPAGAQPENVLQRLTRLR